MRHASRIGVVLCVLIGGPARGGQLHGHQHQRFGSGLASAGDRRRQRRRRRRHDRVRDPRQRRSHHRAVDGPGRRSRGAVTIDGYTQPGSSPNTNGPGLPDNSVHQIELDGTNSGGGNGSASAPYPGGFCFRGAGPRHQPRALLCDPGLLGATATTIEGCFLGLDPTGLTALPNGYGSPPGVGGRTCTIGGQLPAQRNVISRNLTTNIGFGCNTGNGGSGHTIEGNFIGPDATGTALPLNATSNNNQSGISLCFGRDQRDDRRDDSGIAKRHLRQQLHRRRTSRTASAAHA